MSNAIINQTAANITGKTLATLEDSQTFTGDKEFDGAVDVVGDLSANDVDVSGTASLSGTTNISGTSSLAGNNTDSSTKSRTGVDSLSGSGAIVPSVSGSQVGWERRTKTIFTNAQIKALPITPIALVPAPGVNKVNKFKGAYIVCNFQAGHYTNIDAAGYARIASSGGHSESNLIANDATTDVALTDLNELFKNNDFPDADLVPFTNAATPMSVGDGNAATVNANRPANEALQFSVENNASGAFTGGHANNSMIIYAYYDIVDVP